MLRMRSVRPGRRSRRRGQSLVEFALIFPVFIAILGGIVQFGMVFWAQNTLTQVVRDTGRYAATQNATPCDSAIGTVGGQADVIAANASLWGHTANEFASPTKYTSDSGVNGFSTTNAMAIAWVKDSGANTCPPADNQSVWHVTIRINQRVPTFFPGMQFIPALGTCDSNGCHIDLSSTAQFRMEPAP